MTSTWLPDPTSSTGTPLAWTSTTETSWLLSDPFKNVSDSVPAGSATVTGSQTLGAFGTPTTPATGTMIDQSLGFHGQYLDARTGLYNVRARDYSAQTGRFTASDPVAIPHGSPYANGYTYAFGNPMVAVDPSGLTPDWLDDVGGWISNTGSYIGNEAVGAWNGAKETANAVIHPIQTYNGMVTTCNDGFDQWSGGTGATFDGFLQCVDNLNPVAGIRRDVATALSADCETESAQAMGHALFGAGMLATPGVKGLKGAGTKSTPTTQALTVRAPAAKTTTASSASTAASVAKTPAVARFVASKQGIIDTQAPALKAQIAEVAESMQSTGAPPPGVRQGGLPGKPGVYGNKSGALPEKPLGYYHESDVWPGPGPRGTERLVTGGPGEVWYTPDHYGTFRPWQQ